MLINAFELSPDSTIETDICVVGAGVAGISFAMEYIDAGYRVCLLESGGIEADRVTQSLNWGKNIGFPYFELDKSRARFFGGTSHFWHIPIGDNRLGVRLRGLDPIDFEARDWVPYSGWPFDISHLEPFYRRAHQICRIGPYSYDPADWMSSEDQRRQPRLTGEEFETTVFQFGDREVFFKTCRDALERSENIRVFTHANCVNIAVDDNAQVVTALQAACLNGPRFNVKARTYILAAGGIEVPRLLLASNHVQKAGLGNGNDLVGRFFMEHPHLTSGAFIPADVEMSHALAFYGMHQVNGVTIMGKLALNDAVKRRERLLNHSIHIAPDFNRSKAYYKRSWSKGYYSGKSLVYDLKKKKIPRNLKSRLIDVARDIPSLSRESYRHFTNRFLKEYVAGERMVVYRLNHMAEQVPNPESRVLLDEEKDAFGMNRIKLKWELMPQDLKSMIRTQEILSDALKKKGLGRLIIEMKEGETPRFLRGGWHHMGTTRMHVDPKKGVVDKDCRVHDISNLYIAGASVFPTSGYANPVVTTVALAVRLADHVKKL
ncbi:MAG: GMC family oxidoreductase [Desulfococcus multivorans]|jgi:choline dehydrogenase-like flavoprotein|nr:GMC family oxidoreductase [Desulfococcus multivorans]